jgi:hypothetical protein
VDRIERAPQKEGNRLKSAISELPAKPTNLSEG